MCVVAPGVLYILQFVARHVSFEASFTAFSLLQVISHKAHFSKKQGELPEPTLEVLRYALANFQPVFEALRIVYIMRRNRYTRLVGRRAYNRRIEGLYL